MMREHEHDTRWHAVISRTRSADGQFVYGVSSTGIYCRPSCHSKLPKRENVVFFDMPVMAEQAGFRPCKRCRPREAHIDDPRLSLVQGICDYIQQHVDQPDRLSLAAIGAQFHFDPQYVQGVFKDALGVTPRQFAEMHRIDHLKGRLRMSSSVSEAIYDAGFNASSRVYERANDAMGMTPAAYRDFGRGARIAYTVAECSFGWLLVGMTERGICAVGIYDSAGAAEAALRDEYPQAEIEQDAEGLETIVRAILDHVDGVQPALDLPLDIRATAFQWRVWQELRRIPRGETRTYTEIAEAIGQPSAVRAVASACASNHAAIVIPCHRVVGKGGKLSGYRWGVERKRALLAREAERE